MPGRGEQVVKGRWRQLNRKQNRARNSSNNSSIGDDDRDSRDRGGSWCGESLLLAMADGPVEVLTPREQETVHHREQQREQRELLLQRELDQQMYYPGMLPI